MESGTSSENSICSADKGGRIFRAVFLDIDGTLINSSGGPFAEDLEQIEAARRQGCRFFLNTGRSFALVPRELRDAPYIDGVSAGGGAHVLVREDGKLVSVYHSRVSGELLRAAAALYIEMGKWCIFEGEANIYVFNREACTLRIEDYLPVKREDDFEVKYPGVPITKITLEGPSPGEKEMRLLGGAFHFYSHRTYHEGIIQGESKARGMEIILDRLGIPRRESIAIGDSANDVEMIRFAGLGVAMGNACDELKNASQFITASCGEGGIARVLRKYAAPVPLHYN
jgi:Cof subfamily protein (haloacid dehalogenase superfamily)